MKTMTDDSPGRSKFEVEQWDLMGRRGLFEVNGRKVTTPELMPVVNPNKVGIDGSINPSELMDTFRFKMIITNSYIINRGEELRERALKEGLHRMLSFDGAIMTDSGTFQSYIYGGGSREVDVDPLEIIRFQMDMGSDIGTILDRFTVPDSSIEEAAKDLEITLRRARDSLKIGGDMEIAVPVQGGRHLQLRERSGRRVSELGTGYAPIGGVVPIMESYDYSLLVDVIIHSKEGLDPSVPVHLFGAGHPMILPLATALGCDFFDSASYVKFAKDNRYMTVHRTYHLEELDTLPCSCPVCCKSDASDLISMPPLDRTHSLARHNLWTIRNVLDEIRSSIDEGTLWEMVERTAMYNPSLYAAVKRLQKYVDRIERFSPRSTRRFICCSGLSKARPEFLRHGKKLNVLHSDIREKRLILSDWRRVHNRNVSHVMRRLPAQWSGLIKTPFGLVPYELMDMYPYGQAIFPPDEGLDHDLEAYMEDGINSVKIGNELEWNGSGEPDIRGEPNSGYDSDLRKIISMIRYQFEYENDGGIKALFGEFNNIEELKQRVIIKRSRNTGRIRNVLIDENGEKKHLLSVRAEDGTLTIKIEGARRLKVGLPPPWRRIVVDSETGEFNAKGLNVFCKFVLEVDDTIRAGDDVLVVDEDDTLLAVGRALANSRYILSSRSGIAVRVRDGIHSGKDKDNN
jgi:7-cyano-7-deazaguanine tRNA-ribosyltransferase